jgi:3',5'-cyclic AMP phosphodiesterase CpdA
VQDDIAPCTCLTLYERAGRSVAHSFLWILLPLSLFACGAAGGKAKLEMPHLSDAQYRWIASQIFENETGGKIEHLTFWVAGEDFPSMGIGHFIWFPEGVDAPFDETFPAMLSFVSERSRECVPLPEWLQQRPVPDAPWNDKSSLDAQQASVRVVSLRQWLAGTAPLQAQFIVASFRERWNSLELETPSKAELTVLLQRLLDTPEGLFAVIDYYNFKGLGSNPRERYAGEGWGLVQVLGDVAASANDDATLVEQFSAAAENRLALRVANAPLERNEARWLEGWRERVAAYTDKAPTLAGPTASQFRVTPYLQSVSADAATVVWFSELASPGNLLVDSDASSKATSTPRLACELDYHLAEFRDLDAAWSLPYRHEVRLQRLEPGRSYRVDVEQDGETRTLALRTPNASKARFVVYADSETEPESAGSHVEWPEPGVANSRRRYPADQTRGYAANIAIIADSLPDFMAIAGDLVESGGEQRDWDEFWRQNAALAATVPIVPALGNHDYFAGPGELGGYGGAASQRALSKYRSYFGRPNYYVLDHGPIALIVLDANNGLPERSSMDTNWYLSDSAPEWQEESAQWEWLEQALAEAQRDKAFTFVMFHPAPYSSGVHGRVPGVGETENFSSGRPLQALTPLFLRYGVDAVFNGHDEMYEHSSVQGMETTTDGDQAAHSVHFFTIGIGGDGLRGPDPGLENPYGLFMADRDSPESYDADGVLQDGGKHYGHLLVDVSLRDDGQWEANIKPVYAFPLLNAQGEVQTFEPRVYDDALTLTSQHAD